VARLVQPCGICLVWQPHAWSLSSFYRAAHASRGRPMPRRSARSAVRHMPRVVGPCLVARLVRSRSICLVWQAHAWSLGCFRLAAVLKAGRQSKRHGRRSAQPAAVADAATRPRDRAFLKVGIGAIALPIYWCAAADAQAVGRHNNAREV
jgi:hypothetical protein